jgi:HAD superfamily hydrolase (TIGR01549 family)
MNSRIMGRIQWVFFDLGSTLVDERRAEALYLRDVFRLIREFGPEVDWRPYLRRARSMIARRAATGHRELASKLFESYAARSGLPEFLAKLDDLWTVERYASLWRVFRDVRPALAALSRKYCCGIIANQASAVNAVIRQKLGIAEQFRHIFLSGDVGYAKPDERIFLHALSRVSAPPHETVYVGDRVDYDIAPANRVGMVTVRVRRNSLFSRLEPRSSDEKARFEVDDLCSLTRILQAL